MEKESESKKLKVLVIASDTQGGVGFYRSSQPHEHLMKMFPDEFEVTFNTSPEWGNIEYFKQFDIVHVHKGLIRNREPYVKTMNALKNSNVLTITDIDDSWDLGETHPMYSIQKELHMDTIVKENLSLTDCVTTTTPLFADEIKPYNPNPFVVPNAIDPSDPRFAVNKKPYDKIRVGMIMGSAHEYDVRQMGKFVSKLSPETLDKIQIIMCGWDLRGTIREFDQKKRRVIERPIKPKESTWYKYENLVTDNRRILSPKYNKFLNLFIPNLEYPDIDNEHYRRRWTKDMNHYYSHYSNVDILLAPLEPKHFNYVKSQLKAIECCFSKTALIASNYGPYTLDLVNGENAILIDTDNNEEGWNTAITYLVENPEELKRLQENIYTSIKDTYNLDKVTSDRAEIYRSEYKKKQERMAK